MVADVAAADPGGRNTRTADSARQPDHWDIQRRAAAARYASQSNCKRAERLLSRLSAFIDAADADDPGPYLETIRALEAEVAGLRRAMESRGFIEQAKGIIMARQHCNADEAFEWLVRLSQVQHVKIRDLAATIVEQVQTPPPRSPSRSDAENSARCRPVDGSSRSAADPSRI